LQGLLKIAFQFELHYPMKIKFYTDTTMTSQSIACAVIYAGPDLLLAIEARPGRFPIKITNIQAPQIKWVAKDGAQEHIELSGPNAVMDHRNLQLDLEIGELLVAEVNDPENVAIDNASYQLVGFGDRQTMERCRS
jgi:hypothetical protein